VIKSQFYLRKPPFYPLNYGDGLLRIVDFGLRIGESDLRLFLDLRIVQKQRNLTVIRRLNITEQGSRFESSKPDLNELAAIDILFVKNDMQSGASRWVRQVHVVYNLKEGTRNDAKSND
jgi:hypothetical protein